MRDLHAAIPSTSPFTPVITHSLISLPTSKFSRRGADTTRSFAVPSDRPFGHRPVPCMPLAMFMLRASVRQCLLSPKALGFPNLLVPQQSISLPCVRKYAWRGHHSITHCFIGVTIGNHRQPPAPCMPCLAEEPTKEETAEAVKSMKRHKARRIKVIPAEVLQALGDSGIERLHAQIIEAWQRIGYKH